MNDVHHDSFGKPDDLCVGDRNVERLLLSAYDPEPVSASFAERVRLAMQVASDERVEAQRAQPAGDAPPAAWKLMLAAAIALSAIVALFSVAGRQNNSPTHGGVEIAKGTIPTVRPETRELDAKYLQPRPVAQYVDKLLKAKLAVATPELTKLALGDSLSTGPRERKRAALPDGSIVWLNERSNLEVAGPRQLSLYAGEAFFEVAPQTESTRAGKLLQASQFVVTTPQRDVVALGTKFNVRVAQDKTEVTVAQGKVAVDGVQEPLTVGEQLLAVQRATSDDMSDATVYSPAAIERHVAPRVSALLDWAKELSADTSPVLVPASAHEGGALVVKAEDGQETRLSMRKYHVDVHIEDGFARTTIDQTYFNHLPSRQEGTFFFPLPADASISRLAMYVAGKLMEGGMAERQHAAEVFESIKRKMQDPALLEWIDGTTFRMRVFPLEGREEKRIILSYTQRLPALYGKSTYRFPAGHNLGKVGLWSATVHVKNSDGSTWRSPSHTFVDSRDGNDMTLSTVAKETRLDRDIVVELTDKAASPKTGEVLAGATNAASAKTVDRTPRIAAAEHELSKYLMLRQHPELPRTAKRERRDWILVVETSADRDPLLARAQIEVARGVLGHVEHDDTFTILTAAAAVNRLTEAMEPATVDNVHNAIARLEDTQLLGAFDFAGTLAAIKPIAAACNNPYLVHVGSGYAALGTKNSDELLAALPAKSKYIGIGVGKRWNRALMKLAAAKSGGYFAQINPDEDIAWRSLDLVATLNTPRLLDVRVTDNNGDAWLAFDDMVADGEEVCAIVRRDSAAVAEVAGNKAKVTPEPTSVTITGTLDGKPFTQTYPIANVAANANYLPRMWAKLEIDRLLAENAEANKERITTLSKAMYVMSPYTSLLVLENDEMYTTYNVDRGRKDHWAMYPCPDQIPVVREPLTAPSTPPSDSQTPLAGGATGAGSELEKRVAEMNAKSKAAIDSLSMQPRFLASYMAPAWNKHYWRRGGYGLATGASEVNPFGYESLFGRPNRGYVNQGLTTLHSSFGAMPMSGGGSHWAYSGYGLNQFGFYTFRPGRGEALYEDFSGPVNVEFEGLNVDAAGLGWSQPMFGEYYRNSGAAGLGLQWRYASPTYWGEFDSRTKMLGSSVDFTTPYYAAPNFGDTILSFQAMNGTSSGSAFYKERFAVPRMYSMADGTTRWDRPTPPAALWSTQPLVRNSFNGNIDWLMPPPSNQWYEVGGGRYLLPLQTIAPNNGRGLTAQTFNQGVPVRLLALPGPQAADRLSSSADGWIDLDLSANFTDDFRLGEVDRRYGSSLLSVLAEHDFDGDGILEQRVLNRQPALRLLDDYAETLAAPVRIEYYDELDRIVVNGIPQDVERTLELIRQEDQLTDLQSLIKDQKANLSQVERLKRRSLATERGTQLGAEAKQRLADWQRAQEPVLPGPALNLIYQHPNLNYVPALVQTAQSLASYASGMYSTPADMQAVLEKEVREHRPTLGKIDEEARKLIDRARARDWQRVTIPMVAPYEPQNILVDGQGRYRYTRHTEYGLAEEVVCDGTHEWRLYAELGLGAKRTMSRYHRAEIEQLVPWLVPTAEDLAVGGDVTRIDNHTVAVVRTVEWEAVKIDLSKIAKAAETPKRGLTDSLAEAETRPESETEAKGPASDNTAELAKVAAPKIDVAKLLAEAPREKRSTRYEMRMVFVDDGRLSERQWLVDGKLILRVTYGQTGHIVWSDAEGKNLAERTQQTRPSAPPSVVPDTKALVVLPLPWRRWGTGPTAGLPNGKAYDYAKYTEEEATAALAAFLVENNASAVQELIARRYFATAEQMRGKTTPPDRRIGFYTLLCLAGCNWQPDSLVSIGGNVEQKIPAAPLADHPESPIAWLLARELADRQIGHAEPPAMPKIQADRAGRSLAATLINLRKLYRRDDPATAVNETSPDQVEEHFRQHWQTANAFVHNTRSPFLAMSVLQTMQKAAVEGKSAWTSVANGYDHWSKHPAWSSLARYEAARAWFKSGDRRKAQAGFTSWYADLVKGGEVPLVDQDFRRTFFDSNVPVPPTEPQGLIDSATDNQFTRMLLDAANTFTSQRNPRAALLIAWQAYQLEQPALGDEIVNRTLASLPAEESKGTMLAAVQVLYHAAKYERADALLTPMLDDDSLSGFVSLWRLGADLAERRGRIAESVQRWEKVAEMEYARLGESYDVATAREPFESLMQRYEKLVTALAATEQPVSDTFVAKIVQAADRWRALDTDPTAACMSAAKVLSALGKEDLAWAYATTPMASAAIAQAAAQTATPSTTASPYAVLARQLSERGEAALAVRAYTAAQAEEPNDAQLLWEHAQLLERHGRFAEARTIYEQIKNGQWSAAQAGLKVQAAERISGASAKPVEAREAP